MKKPAPLVSVVIPTFNRSRILPATIRSVLNQTYRDFELIVVDDGSTDDTAAVVAEFGDAVRLIRQENKGITGARNTGLRAARGTWIALQDSDDYWLPGKLAQHVRDMEDHPELKVFFVEAWLQRNHLGKEVLSFDHSGFSSHLQPGLTVIQRPLYHQIRYGVAWVQCSLVRRDLLEHVGLYDEQLSIFTDFDLFCRLALHAAWGINRTPLVRIQRLADDKSYVSSQRTKSPAKGYRTMCGIMTRLLARADLTPAERTMVRHSLQGNLSALGNALWRSGDRRGARDCYQRSLQIQVRPGVALKWLGTLLWPGRLPLPTGDAS